MGSGLENDETMLDIQAKRMALKVAKCVVSVVVPYKHDEIPKKRHNGHSNLFFYHKDKDEWFYGLSGLIMETDKLPDGTHTGYILTAATPFLRKRRVQLDQIEVKVYLSDSKLCKGTLLGRDFHYNMAVVRIVSDTPLQVANLKCLEDNTCLDPDHSPQLQEGTSRLLPDSNSFKILPGDHIFAVTRSYFDPHPMILYRCAYSLERQQAVPNECCCITGIKKESVMAGMIVHHLLHTDGGAVINYFGEVIGLMMNESLFLPANVVSRWWKHYRSCGKFRRPWIGCEVDNLYGAPIRFLEKFTQNFPDTDTASGVVVKKVGENSPAYCSGVRCGDVIVGAGDGKLVQNTLEFYEKIWDNDGDCIKFDVLRVADSSRFKSTTMISKVTKDMFCRWKLAGVFQEPSKSVHALIQQDKSAIRRCKRRKHSSKP